MGLVVLAYPDMSDDNFTRIQKFREINDRYYNILKPHFILVSPVYDIRENDFVDHVKRTAAKFTKINFTLNCALTAKDLFGEYCDILLVPDKGNSDIIKLHNSFYTDLLSTHLRFDIPFIPHMVIGNDPDSFFCRNQANELNKTGISINGYIERLSIAHYNGIKVENIEDISLTEKLFSNALV